MKNYQEFIDYVKENVADYLPEKFEQAEITVHQMVKNNDVMLDGLNIHDPDSNLSPNIYLNPLYEQYENGRDLDEIVAEVADTYVENMGSALTRDFQLNVEDIRNFEAVKDNIFPKLVNLEKNSSRLEHVPYTQKEDLAVTYHIKMTGDSRTLGSLMITDAMLEGYGVNKEELHALAMDNICRMLLTAIWHILADLKPYTPEGFLESRPVNEAKVLTTSQALNLLKQRGYVIKDDTVPVT